MSLEEPDLVIRALRDPLCTRGWPPRQFELLYRQSMRNSLFYRLAAVFVERGLAADVPVGLAGHFAGARRLLQSHRAEILREARFIEQALAPLQVPVILLKGAAYLMADLPAAKGRMFSDIDILVPRERLDAVEAQLLQHGWIGTNQDTYDQQYYRQWMHELPPMVHALRQSALDVHHAITPLTCRWRVASGPLIAAAVPVPGHEWLKMLAPVDMVLHSMVHLLLNDDLSHGLRDVSDLDLLLRHFGRDEAFWQRLVERAQEFGLQRALHHGLWCVGEVMRTPVPAATRAAVAGWGPAWPAAGLLRWAWRKALRTPHPSVDSALTPLAMFLLYLRGHWLRMPPAMLARHLATKLMKRRQQSAVRPA